MDHPAFDPLRQHLIFQMSQNLLRLQLNSLNSPTLPPGTPPSPFINFPTTPTNGSGFFNWPCPLNWPSTPTLPYLIPSPSLIKTDKGSSQDELDPPVQEATENRGYSRWWETAETSPNDDAQRTSSGDDSGRGTSVTPSSIERESVTDDDDEDVFVDVVSDQTTLTTTTPTTPPPSATGSKHRRLPFKKRPRNLPPIPTLQNPDISSTSTNHPKPPMTLPAPFTMPVTPLSIPTTPMSMPASPWHFLLQRQQMWNSGTPYSPVCADPSSPTFFKFPPPPSFLSPQSEDSPRTSQYSSSSITPEPESSALSSLLSPATPEWLEDLKNQIAVLPSDSLNLMTDAERQSRLSSMSNLTDDQYTNLRRYLEKRSYSVRDEIGKEDYVPRPIILRSEFVSLQLARLYKSICPF